MQCISEAGDINSEGEQNDDGDEDEKFDDGERNQPQQPPPPPSESKQEQAEHQQQFYIRRSAAISAAAALTNLKTSPRAENDHRDAPSSASPNVPPSLPDKQRQSTSVPEIRQEEQQQQAFYVRRSAAISAAAALASGPPSKNDQNNSSPSSSPPKATPNSTPPPPPSPLPSQEEKNQIVLSKWKCDRCDKSFSQRQNLRNHFEAIHNKTILKCVLCGATSKWRSNLVRHFLIQHNIKSGAGDYIRVFRSSRSSKSNDWRCDHCESVSLSRDSLRDHRNAHHRDLLFRCTLCSVQHKWKRAMTEHLKEKHEVDKDDAASHIRVVNAKESSQNKRKKAAASTKTATTTTATSPTKSPPVKRRRSSPGAYPNPSPRNESNSTPKTTAPAPITA